MRRYCCTCCCGCAALHCRGAVQAQWQPEGPTQCLTANGPGAAPPAHSTAQGLGSSPAPAAAGGGGGAGTNPARRSKAGLARFLPPAERSPRAGPAQQTACLAGWPVFCCAGRATRCSSTGLAPSATCWHALRAARRRCASCSGRPWALLTMAVAWASWPQGLVTLARAHPLAAAALAQKSGDSSSSPPLRSGALAPLRCCTCAPQLRPPVPSSPHACIDSQVSIHKCTMRCRTVRC